MGQAALVELQVRADDDDGAAGVVDALAEQVLAEAALLALEDVRQGLERPVAGADDDAAAGAVLEQRVHGLLQEALLVEDHDFGRAQGLDVLEAVVAVDDAPVEVVEVGGREAAALQGHEGRSSGGMTGSVVRIIHCGSLPDSMKPWRMRRRRISLERSAST